MVNDYSGTYVAINCRNKKKISQKKGVLNVQGFLFRNHAHVENTRGHASYNRRYWYYFNYLVRLAGSISS